MSILQRIKSLVEREGYRTEIQAQWDLMFISARTGHIGTAGEPLFGFVLRIYAYGGQISFSDIRPEYGNDLTAEAPGEVLTYLRAEFPNIPKGEKNTWKGVSVSNILMQDRIRALVEAEGYICSIDPELQRIIFIAYNGEVRESGDPKYCAVAEARIVDGKIMLGEWGISRNYSWEVEGPEEILTYLLKTFPNIPLGEENTWE